MATEAKNGTPAKTAKPTKPKAAVAGPKSFKVTYVFKDEGKSLWIYQSKAAAGGDGKVYSGVNQIYLRKDEYNERPKGDIEAVFTIR